MRQRQLRKQGGVGRSTESINPTKYLLQGHPSSAFLQVFFWFSKLEKALWEGHSIPQQVCPTQPGIEGTEPGCTRATDGISSRKWEDLRSGKTSRKKWSVVGVPCPCILGQAGPSQPGDVSGCPLTPVWGSKPPHVGSVLPFRAQKWFFSGFLVVFLVGF